MVTLTTAAVSTLERVLAKSGPLATGLRIMVTDGGCAGLKYVMGLESAAGAGDRVVDCGGVRLFIDPDSQPHLDGVVVDYVETLEGGGFRFDNPKAARTCGCGKSFAAACTGGHTGPGPCGHEARHHA